MNNEKYYSSLYWANKRNLEWDSLKKIYKSDKISKRKKIKILQNFIIAWQNETNINKLYEK